MTIQRHKEFLTAILLSAAVPFMHAAMPVPVFPVPEGVSAGAKAPQKNAPVIIERDTDSELSIAFWARFDKLPSSGSPSGLFGCRADKDGYVHFTLKSLPTQFQGDYKIKSSRRIKRKEWHHYELSYSKLSSRAALYIDGALEWENDIIFMPELAPRSGYDPVDFSGKVKDLKVYDVALPNEFLAIGENAAERLKAVSSVIEEAKTRSKVKGLSDWIAKLGKDAAALAAREDATAAELGEIERDALKALKMAKDTDKPGHFDCAGRMAALYTVSPLSQEPCLPYAIPESAVLTNTMSITIAPGESESGSVVAVAYAPLEVRNVSASDFTGPAGRKMPASIADVKIVKRWFRTGGAWLSYHSDRRQRNLTPGLLLNDDSLVLVDETKRRNYIRLDYPEGSFYTDVSDPDRGHTSWQELTPFKDSEKIMPHRIGEAGRNQQYLFTFTVPKGTEPGTYRGSIVLSIPGGDAKIDVALSVLPIELPDEPSPYGKLDKTYISHMNSFPRIEGTTIESREKYCRDILGNIRKHNLHHTTGIWDSPELAKMSLEAGLIPDKIFGSPFRNPKPWFEFFPAAKLSDLTLKDKEMGLKASLASAAEWKEYFEKTFPDGAEQYAIFNSETDAYAAVTDKQAELAATAHLLGQKVFAHTMKSTTVRLMGDIQDMTASTSTLETEAKMWKSAGGELINYCDPFPSSENPMWYRRKIGLLMYKTGLDGHMLHGFRQGRTPFNEFAEDLGGDGNYRNFSMAYPMRGGAIYTLAWEGMREAYDDLRYATRLSQIANANIASKSDPLRREAKRALLWLEMQDGKTADLDMVREGVIRRILVLQETVKRHGGVMPDANMALSVKLQ